MADGRYPNDLRYHEEHGWARIEGDSATFGISWYAQDSLQEVVFFDPPTLGATVTKDQTYAEVESVKAVSELYAPLSGEVVDVNAALGDAPTAINEDPYGQGWLVKVRLADVSEADSLMSAEEYEASVAS
jgi:glycine cleavage system H protein